MPKVVVTVVDANSKENRDFEIPSDMRVKDIAVQLAEIFKGAPDTSYKVEAQPLGRALHEDESLEKAGVWEGSLLVLFPVAEKEEPFRGPELIPSPEPVVSARDAGTPVLGWKALDLVRPKDEVKKRQSKGFVWKQLD